MSLVLAEIVLTISAYGTKDEPSILLPTDMAPSVECSQSTSWFLNEVLREERPVGRWNNLIRVDLSVSRSQCRDPAPI